MGRKPNLALRIGIGLVVVLVLAGGYFFLVRPAQNATSNIKAGDCIKVVNASLTNPEIQPIDCASAEATHKVAKNLPNASDKCPADGYDEYTETGGNSAGFKLCMIPTVKVGDCLEASVIGPTTKAACGADTIRVTKVIDAVDEAACGDDVPFSFPEPPFTFCGRLGT